MRFRLLGLAVVWLATIAATPVLPLRPPPPDLSPLVTFVTAPLEKPPVRVPEVALPPVPVELPPVPAVPVALPQVEKPMAPLPEPGTLPCFPLITARQALLCGRARLVRGDWEEGARNLQQAAQGSEDSEVIQEARYWLGEAYYRFQRWDDAALRFRQVIRAPVMAELKPWAYVSAGWTALHQNDPRAAEELFRQLLGVTHSGVQDGWARYGLAVALMAQGRLPDAERVWAELMARRPPPELGRDAAFWHGETLRRLDRPEPAAAEYDRFVAGGQHVLLEPAIARLGWSLYAARRYPEAVRAFRAYAGYSERDLVSAGLALALLATGSRAEARTVVRDLEARRSSLAVPVLLRLAASAAEGKPTPEGQALVQDLVAAKLTPPVRAWLLLLKGRMEIQAGNLDEARTQFELARTQDAAAPIGSHATLQMARVDFGARQFPQVVADLTALLATALSPDMRLAALLLQGEAAYQAGDHATAAGAFQSALDEFPQPAEAAGARLALAWTALRRGQASAARQQFLDFARAHPADPQALEALVVASELTLAAGDLASARDLLESIVTKYPGQPRAAFSRLNRAILFVRSGQPMPAQPILEDWLRHAPPLDPLLGRAWGTYGVALLTAGHPPAAKDAFEHARREGLGALSSLGLGAVALALDRWDEAARRFTEARDTGTAPVAAVATYGLGVVAFRQGRPAELKAPALAAYQADPHGPRAPALLYALTGIDADASDWSGALGAAKRLVAEFAGDEAADDALERVGHAAVQASAWPVAVQAYDLLRQRYPLSPFIGDSQVAYAQALLQVGRTVDARRELERFVGTAPSDPRAPVAWMALARAREATGDRPGALEAYARAERDTRTEWTRPQLMAHVRLLIEDRRWEQARRVLDRLLRSPDATTAADGAMVIGETYQSENQPLPAAEYYMTAAYLTPDTVEGKKALLAAARSFAALKQTDAATIVYKKLLAQADVPADLLTAARKGLADLGR